MTGIITSRTIHTYDQIATQYAQRWADFSLEPQIESFTGLLETGRPVLDLGCGPGRDMTPFAKRGFQVIGLDRSGGMLREAAKRTSRALVLADMRVLPFAAGQFGGVWASASLLHLPKADLPGTLVEIRRVLGAGYLYLALKAGQSEGWEMDQAGRQRYFAYYQDREVEALLNRAGFEILSLTRLADMSGRAYDWLTVIGRG